jgi:hypothetical protein
LRSRTAIFVLGLVSVFSVGCGSKTVTTRPSAVDRADAGPGGPGGPNPDDKCLVFVDDDKREPGQACVCASDCTTGTCDQGVCCEGAACGAKRPDGASCTDGAQCSSGFCADGVCCNVACTGACLACNQPEMMGECSPVGAGVDDPHMICRTDAPDTCGQSGVCNGQGGCAKYPADTICKLGLCDAAGQFVPPGTCDGDGTCTAGVAISCSPSLCVGSECVRICTGDDQCVAGKSCIAGSCGKFGPGQTCDKNEECESNFCIDGVCCENACAGACQTCGNPMSRGKCVPVAAGVTDAACPVMPVASCGTNGKCDGKGACSTYDDNTVCRPAKCDAAANVATPAARCQGGACPAPQNRSCAPFKGCNGNACLSTCGSDGQCAGGNVCTGGSCGKRADGGRCNSDNDCDSGNCAQGFCCATACNGLCKSCGLAGRQGICSDVPAGGADPSGRCKDDACNNECNGQGGCRREPVGTPCGAATCGGAVRTVRTCTADGTCGTSTQTCNGATPVCKPDGCAPPEGKGPGQACVKPADCRTGLSCVASGGTNICCTQACGGPCQQCAASGTSCVAKPDGGSCGINSSCDGGTCCAVGTKKCGAACVNTDTSPANCGACGHACGANQQCTAGKCVCRANLTACMVGGALVCVDTNTSRAHCGGCNQACATVCVAGKCTITPPVCLPPTTMCTNGCKNLNNDAANCGKCGAVCPAGQSCRAGACVAPPPMCMPPTTMCPAGCRNLNNDEANCGACGKICPAGQTCMAGACKAPPPPMCQPPTTMCPNGCKNLNNDEANCGGCGKACPAGQTCMAGACKAPPPPMCQPPTTMCPNGCKNLNNDEANCGGCGKACPAGQTCMAGACKAPPPPMCPGNQTMCPNGCKNLNNDEANCGGCGKACPAGQTCMAGACKAPMPPMCPGNQTMCPAGCKNLNNDEANCGKCGNACGTGMVCRGGACQPMMAMCPPRRPMCGGVCCPILRCQNGQCMGGV